jgi:hypothetical protein
VARVRAEAVPRIARSSLQTLTLSNRPQARKKLLAERAGLDEGLLQFSLSNLLYMENPYMYKKFQ